MADRNEARIAPVPLPAGQFELSELHSALETAISVKDREQHPERIAKAIVGAIHNPELLAAVDAPAVPTGAELVDQDIVYAEGSETVTRPAVAFKGVKAKNGTEAAGMRYDEGGKGPAAGDADAPATIAEQAAERIAGDTDTETSTAGGKSK